MIYATLCGGLGNQMFIIATVLAKALDESVDFFVSEYTNEGLTNVTERESYRDTIMKHVPRKNIKDIGPIETYNEWDGPMPKKSNIHINGYFQNSKFFDHYRPSIQRYFSEYYKTIEQNVSKYFELVKTPIKISIHVRRGDYLNFPQYHPVQDEDYYYKAMKIMYDSLNVTENDVTFLIFSEDKEWCDKVFSKIVNKMYIKDKDEVEFYTMSKCDHNIIANSSFSWWAAYLNYNEDKIVVSPYKWFGQYEDQEDKHNPSLSTWIVI